MDDVTLEKAIGIAVNAGYRIKNVAATGSCYLQKEGYKNIRISNHARSVKSKIGRRRTVSININDHKWEQKLNDSIRTR